jgi:hypothetical protein
LLHHRHLQIAIRSSHLLKKIGNCFRSCGSLHGSSGARHVALEDNGGGRLPFPFLVLARGYPHLEIGVFSFVLFLEVGVEVVEEGAAGGEFFFCPFLFPFCRSLSLSLFPFPFSFPFSLPSPSLLPPFSTSLLPPSHTHESHHSLLQHSRWPSRANSCREAGKPPRSSKLR